MTNLYKILLVVSVIGLFFLWFWQKAENSGIKTEVIKEQQQQIEVQHNVITEQKQVFQRKIVNKSFSTNANLEWLRQNLCQDCQS